MPYLGNVLTSFNVDGNNINNGAITSEKIAAGAVVNADVNDTASIAGTKISADFGAQDLIVDTNLLFVDVSTDRVGVGTSTPESRLHSTKASTSYTPVATFSSQAGTAKLRVDDVSNSASTTRLFITHNFSRPGGVFTADTESLGVAAIKFDDGSIALSTDAAGDADPADRLFINSSGNVGVGTTSPSQLLHLSSSGPRILLTQTSANSNAFLDAATSGVLEFSADDNNVAASSSIRFKVDGGEKARIDSSGRLGIGTSSPGALLDIQESNTDAIPTDASVAVAGLIRVQNTDNSAVFSGIGLQARTSSSAQWLIGTEWQASNQGDLFFRTRNASTTSAERLRITNAGNVGIGTTSPNNLLHLAETGSAVLNIQNTGGANSSILNFTGTSAGTAEGQILYDHASDYMRFYVNRSEAARIDSSGRLLVGTTTSASQASAPAIECIGNTNRGGELCLGRNDTEIGSNHSIGFITFRGNDSDGSYDRCAQIDCAAEGNHSNTSKPSRLAFSTTASSSTSPTERMRIAAAGDVTFGNMHGSPGSFTPTGATIGVSGYIMANRSGNTVLFLNRKTSDGRIATIAQDDNTEGSIDVNGTTVSFNGGHLSRWSQLSGGAERTEILRGSVLSNLDEMCEWGEEENEQLNRMQVSNVEGDKNVAGVFQAWDDDDDTYTNDFYCAMTGDFIIRIAQGVTVERGDLLMSAGDGTAKPQDDDIIRSKTIAKVTSTNVSCTYDDGSYCVPCVLMAC